MQLPFAIHMGVKDFSSIGSKRKDDAECVGIFLLDEVRDMIENGELADENNNLETAAAAFMGYEFAEIVQATPMTSPGPDIAVIFFKPMGPKLGIED